MLVYLWPHLSSPLQIAGLEQEQTDNFACREKISGLRGPGEKSDWLEAEKEAAGAKVRDIRDRIAAAEGTLTNVKVILCFVY